MERLYSKNKTRNMDVFSDPSNRMPQRPVAVKSGEGLGFEVFGSSFDSPKAVRTYGKTSKGKFKPAESLSPKQRGPPPRISEDESDDELLLSSQSSMKDNATSPSKRVAKGKTPVVSSDEEETVRVNGRLLRAHPNYKPSSLEALKPLRFTKSKKSTTEDDSVAEVPPPSSSLNNSQDLLKPISDEIGILDGSHPAGPSSSRQKPSETRQNGSTTMRTTARRLPDARDSSTSRPLSSATEDVLLSPTKPRPRPRVILNSATCQRDSNAESTPRPAARGFPLCSKTPERSTNAQGKRTVKKLKYTSPSRREPQEFPMSLQAKENVSDSAWSGDGSSSKTKKAGISRSATFVHTPKLISLPSPLKTKRVSRGTTFPNLSPLSSSKNKGKARAECPDVDDVDLTDGGLRKRGGPKPFPMSSQMLAGIDRRSKSPNHISTKRASSDDSGAEQGPSAKKRKDLRSGVLELPDYLHEPMEDDSMELGYIRDPSKLCPYCDEELPSHPTPFLQNLLAAARKKSVSDPRPRNHGGLKAPLTIYISVCQRHRFESHQLPIATERGWPKTIDFTKVPTRVKKMKRELEAIILDRDDVSDVEDIDDGSRGPRSKSAFWREIKKEVKRQGSRTVVGVKGQFASFERTQPGYYGEQGSVIIHQTLFDLFPPSTFDASLISPLAPAEFIQRILVPEAAVRLIAQDLCVDMDDATVILRDSAQYGVSMFPDTGENKRKGAGGDDDEMDIADQIVMERARIRRRELAEEEKVEKEMLEEERAAQRAKARESRREKAMERAQQARQNKARVKSRVNAEDAAESETGARQQAGTDASESDAMSVDSLASRRSGRIGKKAMRGGGGKTVTATPKPSRLDSDLIELVDDTKGKASIRRDKAKECNAEPGARANSKASAPRKQKKPLGGFAALDSDVEHENTPRPTRQRMADADAAMDGSRPRICPLQAARNKSGGSSVSDGADSDAPHASRRSQRLDRHPIKKLRSHSWLLSDPSSPDST